MTLADDIRAAKLAALRKKKDEKKKQKRAERELDREIKIEEKKYKPINTIPYNITSDRVRTAYYLLFGKSTRASTADIIKEIKERVPEYHFSFKKVKNRQ